MAYLGWTDEAIARTSIFRLESAIHEKHQFLIDTNPWGSSRDRVQGKGRDRKARPEREHRPPQNARDERVLQARINRIFDRADAKHKTAPSQ